MKFAKKALQIGGDGGWCLSVECSYFTIIKSFRRAAKQALK